MKTLKSVLEPFRLGWLPLLFLFLIISSHLLSKSGPQSFLVSSNQEVFVEHNDDSSAKIGLQILI